MLHAVKVHEVLHLHQQEIQVEHEGRVIQEVLQEEVVLQEQQEVLQEQEEAVVLQAAAVVLQAAAVVLQAAAVVLLEEQQGEQEVVEKTMSAAHHLYADLQHLGYHHM
jgi:hypothetical protein